MRARLLRLVAIIAAAVMLIFVSVISAAAMDDTYRFEDLGMSLKLPKSYSVITRDTPRDDKVFSEVNLNYDDTMTAFHNANIYMWAYDPDMVLQISLTATQDANSKAVNNYSDLTAAERKAVSDTISAESGVTSAVEVKHNGNIFFDSQRSAEAGGTTVYIDQSNTVINGLQIDLTLQKKDEAITPEEAKVLTNVANSMSFDNIRRNTGPVFDWWRLLLWVGILAALSVAISVIYKHNNNAQRRRLEERRARRAESEKNESELPEQHNQEQRQTFEEALGYMDDEEFNSRAEADEMSGSDISVRERDPSKGVSYFEDGGDSIDDGTDYFDTYFKEPTESRTPMQRLFSTVSAYFRIAVDHTVFFFKNLFRKIFKKKK